MARQDYGDDLLEDILLPGWKLSDDGFGLHTLSATFKADATLGFEFLRGDPFTVEDYNYCKLHKQTTSFDALGIATTNAEYVGIDPDINSGNYTNPQITSAGGLTTEKIESHPYFAVTFAQSRLRIAGSEPYTASPIGPLVAIKNPANYNSITVPGGAIGVTKQQSFIGDNGACFENATGGKFLGFFDPAYPYFYGKTSYLAPQQTISGIVYVKEATLANKFLELLNYSSGDANWKGNLPDIIPTYLTGPFTITVSTGPETTDTYNLLLLTQVNIESFGALFKISYEIKYSTVGWHPAVYEEAAEPVTE
jgi:hypothetical protein